MLGGTPCVVAAADFPLPGLKLVLKDVNGGQRALLVAKSATIVVPTPAGPDDPTVVGGSLVLANPGSRESATIPLPAESWTVNATGPVFRFRNRLAPAGPSPARVALLKETRLVKVTARTSGITLDESAQGGLSAVVTVGGTRYCTLFDRGIVRDEPGRFTARNVPAPATCPTAPAATTTPTTMGTSTTAAPVSTTSTTFVEATTTTVTTTTLPPGCAPPMVSLGSVEFTIARGTADCGGAGLTPGGAPPSSGQIEDVNGTKIRDLGVGCLYVGGGQNLSLPGARLPDGSSSLLDVAAADGLALTLAASDGTGPLDCTRGAGPLRHCATGAPGTDGQGLCTTDDECGNGSGICVADANCHLGPPIPIPTPTGALSTCALNVIATDACGTADLVTGDSSLEVALFSRLYLTGNQASPCPRCEAGLCTAGKRAGLGCTAVGSLATSLDCPPLDTQYLGQLPVRLSPLTTAETVVTEPSGLFCPGQQCRGAFGRFDARTVRQSGVPLTDLGGGTLFATRLAGSFCVPATGNGLIDNVIDLPGPGTVSVARTIGVCVLSETCTTLCNPCTLGPLLCDLLCAPCLLCL